MKSLITPVFMMVLLCLSLSCIAQKDTIATFYKIRTNDDLIFKGKMLSENEHQIVLRTIRYGDVTINRSNISSIETYQEKKKSKRSELEENALDSRYFLMPTAHGKREVDVLYQNIWVLFNQLDFHFTNWLSMRVGGVYVPYSVDLQEILTDGRIPFWVMPKLSVPLWDDMISIGAGGLIGTVVNDDKTFGAYWGMCTLGDWTSNITFGVGTGFINDDHPKSAVFILSGMHRIFENGTIITENYLTNGENGLGAIMSFGYRFFPSFGDVDGGIDLGVVLPVNLDVGFKFAPLVSVTIPF